MQLNILLSVDPINRLFLTHPLMAGFLRFVSVVVAKLNFTSTLLYTYSQATMLTSTLLSHYNIILL